MLKRTFKNITCSCISPITWVIWPIPWWSSIYINRTIISNYGWKTWAVLLLYFGLSIRMIHLTSNLNTCILKVLQLYPSSTRFISDVLYRCFISYAFFIPLKARFYRNYHCYNSNGDSFHDQGNHDFHLMCWWHPRPDLSPSFHPRSWFLFDKLGVAGHWK